MTAVFAVTIAIGSKGSAAGRTGVFIYGFPLDKVHVAVPPVVPACVRTELFLFPALGLDHRFSAARAETVSSSRWSGLFGLALDSWSQSISATISLDRIFRDAQFLYNLCIATSGFAQLNHAAFLIWRHQVSLQSLKWFTFLRPKVELFYSAKTKKSRRQGDIPLSAAQLTLAHF